jgi:ribosome-associated translation inhibitor RaiA
MQVIVNSNHSIQGSESVAERVEAVVRGAVERHESRITRVEVHLSDINGPKHGDNEKRCMMEARVGGLGPIAVSHQAPMLLEAIEGAAGKLERAVDRALERREETAGRSPLGVDIANVEDLQELERSERDASRSD